MDTFGSAATEFEAELSRRGVQYRLDGESGRYLIVCDGMERLVSLGNIAREYALDHDASRITRFVDTVLGTSIEASPWKEARDSILFCLEPSDHAEPSEFRQAVSKRVDRVPVQFNVSTGAIRWITRRMLDDWQVGLDEIEATASANLADVLAAARIEHRDIDGVRLGFMQTTLPFKSALVLAPNLQRIVSPSLGWPLHAVIPDRDFLYLWAARHEDFVQRVGGVVVEQFTTSPYPLTTEVFEIGDRGVSAIGAFPVEGA
jgi:hypothetical protein